MAKNEYELISRFAHDQPDYMSPSELHSLMSHIGNMYPPQFIFEMTYHYDRRTNVTYVEIMTTGEKYPNQFSGAERVNIDERGE